MTWQRDITPAQWKTLIAAQLGWMLDAMDVMLYAFALTTLQQAFHIETDTAGWIASGTLLSSAFGGAIFGAVADARGRRSALMWTILIYSFCSAGTATAQTVQGLAIWRMLLGFGLGGEWTSGAVLVAETWPAEHRGKAVGFMQSGWSLGYIAAALLSAALLPQWRLLFLIGVFPALITFWIRKAVPESPVWESQARADRAPYSSLFQGENLRRTVVASLLTASVLSAYWGLFTWLPGFLSTPLEKGGAGMTIVKSAAWIIPVQLGAFLGYVSFGWIADQLGRRPAFVGFMVIASILVPAYGQMRHNATLLFWLGPLVGFFGSGYFSVFGALLAELYPTAIRASGQGFTYNAGRACSALAPALIGYMAKTSGIGGALSVTAVFFLAGAGLIFLLPETRGQQLDVTS